MTQIYFPFFRILSFLTLMILGFIARGQDEPGASSDQLIETLFRKGTYDQDSLDAQTDRLSAFTHQNRSLSNCDEIAQLRTAIVFGCMLGGESNSLIEILNAQDGCVPNHGGYAYCVASIHYDRGNYQSAALNFRVALNKLGTDHFLSVNAQFNLAACLHEVNETEEAIELLKELASPTSTWNSPEKRVADEFLPMIQVNAAAMMVSGRQYHEAIEMLHKLDQTALTPYWNNLAISNMYLALSNSGNYQEADSLWRSNVQFIPLHERPSKLLHESMGSVLATATWEQFQQYRTQISETPSIDPRSDLALFNDLFDMTLPISRVRENWDRHRLWNEQHRNSVKRALSKIEIPQVQPSLLEIKSNLDRANKKIQSWQIVAVSFLSLLLVTLILWIGKERRKVRSVNRALKEVQQMSMDMANAADGEKQHQHFRILPEEMRVLNESLIKGTRISEALKVIRKIEAIHAIFEDIDEININQIPGVALLSPLENAVVKLTITGCSSKEIAIQLKVSTGHVYNCRSVIRSKLDMPQDANFELWLTKNLKPEFGN